VLKPKVLKVAAKIIDDVFTRCPPDRRKRYDITA
jgi:hypothetical protein